MRFAVPVVRSFLAELEDMQPRDMLGPLDLEGICRSQIGLLECVQAAYQKLLPLGWKVTYDDESETLLFENTTVSGKAQSEVEAYLRSSLPGDTAEKLIDELKA